MDVNPIAFAIPVFVAAMGIELLLARRRSVSAYRFPDAITDLSCGIGNQVMSVFFSATLLGAYGWVHDHYTLVRFEAGSVWPWVIGIVGTDFLYYWWHRASHEVNGMWAAHVVHHQSEDYNLAVALRQALFTSFTSVPFYLPLAFLGVPAPIWGASIAISLLYQFFIHTELVGKLPAPIEWLFNTPSHHRVHHATNPQYLDRNYAGIFITWDRMFGSFEPEREPCTYGITKPFGSFNPIWANLHYYGDIAALGRRAGGGPLGFLRALIARPGWNPQTGKVDLPPHVGRDQFVKFDVPAPTRGTTAWLFVQLLLLVAGLSGLLILAPRLPLVQVVVAGSLIFAATLAWSGILERRRWGWALEGARLAGSVACVGWIALS